MKRTKVEKVWKRLRQIAGDDLRLLGALNVRSDERELSRHWATRRARRVAVEAGFSCAAVARFEGVSRQAVNLVSPPAKRGRPRRRRFFIDSGPTRVVNAHLIYYRAWSKCVGRHLRYLVIESAWARGASPADLSALNFSAGLPSQARLAGYRLAPRRGTASTSWPTIPTVEALASARFKDAEVPAYVLRGWRDRVGLALSHGPLNRPEYAVGVDLPGGFWGETRRARGLPV